MFFFFFKTYPIISTGIIEELESILEKMKEQTVKFEYVMGEKTEMKIIKGSKKEYLDLHKNNTKLDVSKGKF